MTNYADRGGITPFEIFIIFNIMRHPNPVRFVFYTLYVLIDWVGRPNGKIFDSRLGRTDRAQWSGRTDLAALGPYVLTSSQIFSLPALPNSVNKHFIIWPLCFLFFLTERTCIDQYAFIAGPYAFFRPYSFHTGFFISYGFPTKLCAGSYRSYDKTYFNPRTCLLLLKVPVLKTLPVPNGSLRKWSDVHFSRCSLYRSFHPSVVFFCIFAVFDAVAQLFRLCIAFETFRRFLQPRSRVLSLFFFEAKERTLGMRLNFLQLCTGKNSWATALYVLFLLIISTIEVDCIDIDENFPNLVIAGYEEFSRGFEPMSNGELCVTWFLILCLYFQVGLYGWFSAVKRKFCPFVCVYFCLPSRWSTHFKRTIMTMGN